GGTRNLCATEMLASLESPRHRPSLGDDPRDHVRDLLRRQRRGAAVTSPIRHSQIRSPGDDRRPHVLIAHEREIGRISDAATAWTASAVVAVTAGAGAGKDLATALRAGGVPACGSGSVVGRNLLQG